MLAEESMSIGVHGLGYSPELERLCRRRRERAMHCAGHRTAQSAFKTSVKVAVNTDSFLFFRNPGRDGTGALTPGIAPSFNELDGRVDPLADACDSGAFPLLLLVEEDSGFEDKRELLKPRADPTGDAALDVEACLCLEA